MKKGKLLEKIQRNIDEITDKINGLRDKILPGTDQKIKEKMKAVIEELEEMQDKVRSQYDELKEIDKKGDKEIDKIEKKRDEDIAEIDRKRDEDISGIKKRNERKWTEMEKNVFSSFRSFNESFRKAGRMLKSRRNI